METLICQRWSQWKLRESTERWKVQAIQEEQSSSTARSEGGRRTTNGTDRTEFSIMCLIRGLSLSEASSDTAKLSYDIANASLRCFQMALSQSINSWTRRSTWSFWARTKTLAERPDAKIIPMQKSYKMIRDLADLYNPRRWLRQRGL